MDGKERLVITLKSDMCVGSGYSYAGIVDSDVCYDECGLPYIPAKRLKGCLREAAGLIGLSEDETDKLFGKSGQDNARGVFLDNAYMEDYESLYEELKHIENPVKEYLTPQNVLDRFTTIKAQTKIMENGVAKDNSLRYIRTVNHYSPLGREQELCFQADVYYEGLNEDDKNAFENTVKALRNIGLNRSRGLGSVKCELKRSEPSRETEIGFDTVKEEDIYILSYSVKNLSPLVLSANQENATEKYISGQRVLGYFANAYLKDGGSAEDAEFEELFLKNEVIFGGLYPCGEADQTNGRDSYYPAPSYINRLKKTGKYVNVSKKIPVTIEECKGIGEEYARGAGNQPKKLKKKFVCFKEGKILVKEVASDIVYHHAKKSTKQGTENGELLYAFEVVSKGQCFAGTITGKGKYIKKLAGLLQNGNLQFGKSRSSQYGKCVLDGVPKIEPQRKEKKSDPKTFSAGERVLVILQSDGIFMDGSGYTVRYEQVREQIKKAYGIEELNDEVAEKHSEMYSEIEVKMLTGYYSVWNLKRPAIPAVCAGSTFEFLLTKELAIPEGPVYVGERIGEGYGRLAIVPNNGEDCCIEEIKEKEKEQKLNYAKPICKRILLDEMRETLRRCAVESNIGIDNPATLGRITLMLTDSINQNPDNPNEAYKDFCGRIQSIKRGKVQEKVEKIKNDLICESNDLSSKLKYIEIKDFKEVYEVYEKQILRKGKPDESDKEEFDAFDNELKKLWSGYLMDVLVQEKYNQKSKEQTNRPQDHPDENKRSS